MLISDLIHNIGSKMDLNGTMLKNNDTSADSDEPNSNTKVNCSNDNNKKLDSKNRKSKKRVMPSPTPDNIRNSNARSSKQKALTINGMKSA